MNQNKMNLRDFAGIGTLTEKKKSSSEVLVFLTISIFLNLAYIHGRDKAFPLSCFQAKLLLLFSDKPLPVRI